MALSRKKIKSAIKSGAPENDFLGDMDPPIRLFS